MLCPECEAPTRVLDSRWRLNRLYRRRECPAGHRFSTTEVVRDDRAVPDPSTLLAMARDAGEVDAVLRLVRAARDYAQAVKRAEEMPPVQPVRSIAPPPPAPAPAPMPAPPLRGFDGKVWCEQCEKRVVRGCASQFCKVIDEPVT